MNITRIAIEYTDDQNQNRIMVIPADKLEGIAVGLVDPSEQDRVIEALGGGQGVASLGAMEARLQEALG